MSYNSKTKSAAVNLYQILTSVLMVASFNQEACGLSIVLEHPDSDTLTDMVELKNVFRVKCRDGFVDAPEAIRYVVEIAKDANDGKQVFELLEVCDSPEGAGIAVARELISIRIVASLVRVGVVESAVAAMV